MCKNLGLNYNYMQNTEHVKKKILKHFLSSLIILAKSVKISMYLLLS